MLDKAIDALDFLARVYMRVRSRIMPPVVGDTFFGARMVCDTRDFIQRRIYHFNIFEPNLSHYILSMVKAGDHVVDVGANVGYMTLLLSTVVGASGRVVAIEAAPSTHDLLQRNLRLNKTFNVIPLNMAATGEPCLVEIITGEENNSGTNFIRKSLGQASTVVTGDALSNVREIDHAKVTFIKIDVEGSEAPIITNILETLDLYSALKSIAVELTAESAHLMGQLQRQGFHAFAFPNNYSIGYLVVRKYLSRSHENAFVVKIPVSDYDPAFRDYIFERQAPVA